MIDVEMSKKMIAHIAGRIAGSKDHLTEVDSLIGDGDHGIGMAKGFEAVEEVIKDKEFSSINELFQTVGMTLINAMGGASGIIFGTMFLACFKGEETKSAIELKELADAFERSLNAIKMRGGAHPGDKTMIDAFQPAVEALKAAAVEGKSIKEALESARKAAQDGMEATRLYVARFGKAKALMERSIGFQDAGAVSVTIIFEAMLEWAESISV